MDHPLHSEFNHIDITPLFLDMHSTLQIEHKQQHERSKQKENQSPEVVSNDLVHVEVAELECFSASRCSHSLNHRKRAVKAKHHAHVNHSECTNQ